MAPDSPPLGTYPARRVTVLLARRDRAGHRSLMVELMRRARRAKMAGATAFEGHRGFGAAGQAHPVHLLSGDAPISVVMVDRADRIEHFLREVAKLLQGALVVVDDIEIVDF